MSNPRHPALTANHRLENWVYADATARLAATGFVSGDVGKIAYQQDDGTYYRLTATTPTWARLAAPASHAHSGSTDGGGTLTPTALTIPTASSPAQTAEGSAVWDSDDDKLTVGTGSGRKTLVNDDDSRLTDSRAPSGSAGGDLAGSYPNPTLSQQSARLPAKAAVRVATTANGTLSTAFANGQTVDGVSLSTGDRILLKDQSTGSQNGIYLVAASGAPTRATDADSAAEVFQGCQVFVQAGTVNANKTFVHTTAGAITLGSTSLTFAELGGGGTPTTLSNGGGSVAVNGSGQVTGTAASGQDVRFFGPTGESWRAVHGVGSVMNGANASYCQVLNDDSASLAGGPGGAAGLFVNTAGDTAMFANGDAVVRLNTDNSIEITGGPSGISHIAMDTAGNITITRGPGTQIKLHNLPLVTTGVTDAIWNDGGHLAID